jgi:hypothetical protein
MLLAKPQTIDEYLAPLSKEKRAALEKLRFVGDGDELVKQVTDSTQGFTLVLAGLKALLEHDVRLNLVADRYPKGIEEH